MKLINKIKNSLQTNRITHPIYARARYVRDRIKNADEFKMLQEQGPQVIKLIQELLENEVLFYFDAGTLLGIIREGKLLKHDCDIDIAVQGFDQKEVMRVRQLFLSNNFKLERSFSIEGIGIVEDAFSILNFRFDVFYIQRENEKEYYYAMYRNPQLANDPDIRKRNVIKLSFTPILAVKKVDLEGVFVNVPENPELYLQERYGENWRIPDKYFEFWNSPSAEKTELIGMRYDY